MWKEVLINFLIGGALIAASIAVGMLVNPVFGGLIAALPIRLGASILLAGLHEGHEFTLKMVEGSLLTYAGTFFFLISLWYLIPRLGFIKGFMISSVVCISIVTLTFKVTGKI